MEKDPLKRFSIRVENYIKYRPRYPKEVLDLMRDQLHLNSSSVIADVGSGTGLSADPFLLNGNKVFGVEPNPEMRAAAERLLAQYRKFMSIDGKAERTNLADKSVDFVLAGQAFHWFERELCRIEFKRILREPGWVILLWNERRQDTSFSNAYESLLKMYAIDYEEVDHRLVTTEVLTDFFQGSELHFKMFDNEQIFDFEGLTGRVLSCSYMPTAEHPTFSKMMNALRELFDRFQESGKVVMGYNTLMYWGRL
jgi:SAM-dependent methyltransferase